MFYSMQLLDMVEQNELNRSLLTLLDENIAGAYQGNQVREFEIRIYYLIQMNYSSFCSVHMEHY